MVIEMNVLRLDSGGTVIDAQAFVVVSSMEVGQWM